MKTKIPKGILEHVKNHVDYPTTKDKIIESCNSMSDVSKMDKRWVEKMLPDKIYQNPNDVLDSLR